MEPFGLFQFLQSLLNSPASTPPDSADSTANTTKETPPTPTQKNETKGNDTYLNFITAHENRIQKTRK